jgi:hypothetical protein
MDGPGGTENSLSAWMGCSPAVMAERVDFLLAIPLSMN